MITTKAKLTTHVKGKVVITDPCYVFPKDSWSDLCNQHFCRGEDPPSSGMIDFCGFTTWWGQTKYGDGCYKVHQNGIQVGEFGVDAGLFGIFPVEFVEKFAPQMLGDTQLATVVEIDGDIEYDDGVLRCGNVTVNTADEEDEEEEEEDWDNEDDEDEEFEEEDEENDDE